MRSEIENLVEEFEARRLTRRELVSSLAALVASASASAARAAPAVPAPAPMAVQGRSLNHVSLAVSNVERARDFYASLLGLEVVSRPGNGGLNLGLGTSFLGLYEITAPGRAHHFCVGVDDYDPDRIAASLRERGIEPRIDRDPRNRTSGGDQLYFQDPDGAIVQLSASDYRG